VVKVLREQGCLGADFRMFIGDDDAGTDTVTAHGNSR
jgi:hypothetical protein